MQFTMNNGAKEIVTAAPRVFTVGGCSCLVHRCR